LPEGHGDPHAATVLIYYTIEMLSSVRRFNNVLVSGYSLLRLPPRRPNLNASS